MKRETVSLVLVNLAGIMERADESLLPGVYKEVGAALHADPTRLGSLTLFRSIVQSSCYPLAAYLAARHNRAHVIALGAFLWAAATFLVAISSTFTQLAISRGLNGIGLAIATPAIQSLVADSTDETNRGTAFGWLLFTGSFGSILGNLISVLLAPTSFMGVAGWRLAFHLVATLSVAIALLLRLFATDPCFKPNQSPTKSFLQQMKELLKEAKLVIKLPSFQVLVIQGVFGMFPWSSLSFTPMWLELMGFSHETTATILTLFSVATSLGALFGGKMGDVVAKRWPNSGRIMLSQISSASAVPLAAVLLLGLPDDPSIAALHGFVFFVMGLFISWNAAATNNPIFAEIVPERARTSIYALDRCMESMLASFAPPVVGILAQHVYGYKPIPDSRSRGGVETDRVNAESLGKALYTAIGIPMVICASLYSLLYCTYPRDRDRARMDSLIESELNQIIQPQDFEFNHFIIGKERSLINHFDSQTYEDNLEDERRLLPTSAA
ncbi:Major facilitator superfamily protein [Perilla frutescens var. frutescens]|nr:Major facilitator superfamily protein [Perilla frutescens var. frutescens]